jgi:DtxR family Mn-dependent transcriptional regulator
MEPKYNPTIEEYVEIIHELQQHGENARVKDIADKRGVTRSSVSTALALLKKKKLIVHETYGQVALTQRGEKLGNELEARHQAIKHFLNKILGLDVETAETDACKLEHYMSPPAIHLLANFSQYIEKCHYRNPHWLDWFKNCGVFSTGDKTQICPFCEIRKTNPDEN